MKTRKKKKTKNKKHTERNINLRRELECRRLLPVSHKTAPSCPRLNNHGFLKRIAQKRIKHSKPQYKDKKFREINNQTKK